MIKAECTWGDGPDVLLTINGKFYDLSITEARKLYRELGIAITTVEELDRYEETSSLD